MSDEDRQDRLASVLANALTYTVNEPLMLNQLEEFLSPKPANLVDSEEEQDCLDKRVDQLQSSLGGAPRLILQKEGEPPPRYDQYPDAALDEILSSFHRCRRSVVRCHMHHIGLGMHERFPSTLDVPDDPELQQSIRGILEERFWEHAETSYIRLASFWDRVGQFLDFVFFNIRQYERDGFGNVMQRIRSNYAVMNESLRDSSDWKSLWRYHKSEAQEGYKWLARRRNLLVHSLYLRKLGDEGATDPLFLSEYNHLEEAVKRKLIPGSPEEELHALHVHLEKSASLLPCMIGLGEIGAKLNPREVPF